MKSIFEYTDYRQYLAESFSEQRSLDPGFSYRVFAERAGFKARDFIYRVIQGQKNLSRQSAAKVSQALRHGKREAEYFWNMVGFNQAKRRTERTRYFNLLSGAGKPPSRTNIQPKRLTQEQFKLYSEWYHVAVRSILDMYEFRDDYEWLAQRVYPNITPGQAKRSVELLEKLGLVQRNKQGFCRLTDRAITTGDKVKQHALQGFYLSCMKLAEQAMDRVPRKERNITGVTIGISHTTYDLIVKKLQKVRRKIADLANRDQHADRVYELNLMLFPLSRTNTKELA